MKRLLFTALLGSAALAITFALRIAPVAGETPAVAVGRPACCAEKTCCSQTTRKTKSDADVVAELVTILNETRSADEYLATLLALGRFEDKSSLPAVVRNAERLGLLKGLCKDDSPTHAQQLIGAYLSGELAGECQTANRASCVPTPAGYVVYPPLPPWAQGPQPTTCLPSPAVNGPIYGATPCRPSAEYLDAPRAAAPAGCLSGDCGAPAKRKMSTEE